jgi:hypothetical protein
VDSFSEQHKYGPFFSSIKKAKDEEKRNCQANRIIPTLQFFMLLSYLLTISYYICRNMTVMYRNQALQWPDGIAWCDHVAGAGLAGRNYKIDRIRSFHHGMEYIHGCNSTSQ